MTEPEGRIVNALTVDVEEYFHATNLSSAVCPTDWPTLPSTVRPCTERILALLAAAGHKATFFTLGWVAERDPALVRQIHAAGHEVACHGYDHRLVDAMRPEEFRRDVTRARAILEDVIGAAVIGYRAPSWSITPRTAWVFEVLAEAGFRYDSSIMPRPLGLPGRTRRFPHLIRAGGRALAEFPVTTLGLHGLNVPVAGGGYFRLYPYWLTRRALARINEGEGRPFVFYVHPWELDPAQPGVGRLPRLAAFRHYVNLARTERRLMRLLAEFRFGPIREVLEYGRRGPCLHLPDEDAAVRLPLVA